VSKTNIYFGPNQTADTFTVAPMMKTFTQRGHENESMNLTCPIETKIVPTMIP
jgi:hypothetical protein